MFSLKCHKKVIFVHISKTNTPSETEFFTLQLLYKAFFHKIIPFQSKFSLKIPCFNFGNAKKNLEGGEISEKKFRNAKG